MNGEIVFGWLAAGVVFGCIGAWAAGTKGNGSAGLVLGFLLGPLGLLIAMLIPAKPGATVPGGTSRPCPYCHRSVSATAKRCGQCGGSLVRKSFRHAVDPVEQWEAQQKMRK